MTNERDQETKCIHVYFFSDARTRRQNDRRNHNSCNINGQPWPEVPTDQNPSLVTSLKPGMFSFANVKNLSTFGSLPTHKSFAWPTFESRNNAIARATSAAVTLAPNSHVGFPPFSGKTDFSLVFFVITNFKKGTKILRIHLTTSPSKNTDFTHQNQSYWADVPHLRILS